MRVCSGTSSQRWPVPTCFLLALVLAPGCGPTKGTVSGKISFSGETLGGGRVDFMTPDGSWADSSPIGDDGGYLIKNAPLGTVKITVETKSVQGMGAKGPPGKFTPPKDTPAQPYMAKGGKYVKIPEIYADREKTTLTYEITKGSQTHDIELK